MSTTDKTPLDDFGVRELARIASISPSTASREARIHGGYQPLAKETSKRPAR